MKEKRRGKAAHYAEMRGERQGGLPVAVPWRLTFSG